ncbi:hypothetical protein S83_012259 [Arachis hypogaea]
MHVEASIMTLHRFGNTSSSSIWYKLAYTEAKGIMRKGNRVWQIVFGRGFKCNRAVWQALRHVKASPKSPWKDCIHRYPVQDWTQNGNESFQVHLRWLIWLEQFREILTSTKKNVLHVSGFSSIVAIGMQQKR